MTAWGLLTSVTQLVRKLGEKKQSPAQEPMLANPRTKAHPDYVSKRLAHGIKRVSRERDKEE
jgi:hypothetical protein